MHYLTKASFKGILEQNKHIDKLWTIEKSIKEVSLDLKKENFDLVIDLHKNLRTLSLKKRLGVPSKSFEKLNLQKWWLVRTKRDVLPDLHIVNRYFETVSHLGVKLDDKPCDFYILPENEVNLAEHNLSEKAYLTVAVGAQFATKVLPTDSLIKILQEIKKPIVLLGGKEDTIKAQTIKEALESQEIHDFCGKINLQQSASLVRQSACILSHDTGLMHIASCFFIPIVSVWGNTVPALGMFPYTPKAKTTSIHEVQGLSCRPCSKIGFQECPKGHFDCMKKQDLKAIARDINLKI
jgi:ADP-heptose:LPS heptosyltransferase